MTLELRIKGRVYSHSIERGQASYYGEANRGIESIDGHSGVRVERKQTFRQRLIAAFCLRHSVPWRGSMTNLRQALRFTSSIPPRSKQSATAGERSDDIANNRNHFHKQTQ